MGRLKQQLNNDTPHIAEYLTEKGFKYTTFVCGGNYGYQKDFKVENGLYYTYVHCDLANGILNIYKEYDCGGEIASYKCNIPKELIETDNVDVFIDWLDEECEYYL